MLKEFLYRVIPLSIALVMILSATAYAGIFGGVEFPQGVASFADAVISYDLPEDPADCPSLYFQSPNKALGEPDYAWPYGEYVSLGNGGSITLQFVDNYLTGSGDDAPDLWIFEIGGAVEATEVEISKDGETWVDVGMVGGATSGVDIDACGFGPFDLFSYVRLTDDYGDNYGPGPTAGADIDAVGAIAAAIASLEIDIKPGSDSNPLNVSSKGVLPVAIIGSDEFNVEDIDPESVTLEGVEALRWDITDITLDDCPDLVLHFDTQEVVGALGEVADGDELTLELIGTLVDGTSVGGTDAVVIKKKGKLAPSMQNAVAQWGKIKDK